MRNKNHFLTIVLLSVLCFSCGGGGGGDDNQHLAYTGITDPAIIDSNNAVDLAVDAFIGGNTDAISGIFSSVKTDQLKVRKEINLYEVAQFLSDPLYKINVYDDKDISSAVQNTQDPIIGPCGGTLTYSVEMDDVTGFFSGSMTFNNYCEAGITISGVENFDGQIDLNTENIINFSIEQPRPINLKSDSQNLDIEGTISVNVSESSTTESVEMLMRDNIQSDTYWVNDYVIIISEEIDYISADISGRFYNPTEGYVDMSTIDAIHINSIDMRPLSGSIEIVGDEGTKANLVFEDENYYHVIADTNGDGEFDYNSGQIPWDSDL